MDIVTAIKSKKRSIEVIEKDTTRHTKIQSKSNTNTIIPRQSIINQGVGLSLLLQDGEFHNPSSFIQTITNTVIHIVI